MASCSCLTLSYLCQVRYYTAKHSRLGPPLLLPHSMRAAQARLWSLALDEWWAANSVWLLKSHESLDEAALSPVAYEVQSSCLWLTYVSHS